MLCPKCKQGTLRINMDFPCPCKAGHRLLVCDDERCFSVWSTKCNPTAGPEKLPPDFKLIYAQLETEAVNCGGGMPWPPLKQRWKHEGKPACWPTVEEYAASLLQQKESPSP